MEEFKALLASLSTYSSLIAIAACLIKFNKLTKRLYALILYCSFSLLTDILLEYFPFKKHHGSQFFLLSTFTVIEYILFAYFLFHSLENKLIKNIILIVSVIFLGYTTYHFFYHSKSSFDSIPASVESLIIISFCVYYFYEQIKIPSVGIIYSTYPFWAIVGMLIYLSGTLFLFLYVASLENANDFTNWYINNVLNIIKNIFFAIAFSMSKKNLSNLKTRIQKPFNI